jgi:hypothetical protein
MCHPVQEDAHSTALRCGYLHLGRIFRTLRAQVDEHTQAAAQHTASMIAPGQLGALLSAYTDGRADALLDILTLKDI